jgi:uncharacterized membrane protein
MTSGAPLAKPVARPHPSLLGLADYLLILLGGVVLLILTFMLEQPSLRPGAPLIWLLQALRILLGLLFVFFVPGYLWQALFFPQPSDLDWIERLGLSLGLSLALLALLALLLDGLIWGLRSPAILAGQAVLIILLVVAGACQRLRSPAGQVGFPRLSLQPAGWWASLGQPERRLLLAMAGALTLAVLAAAWMFLFPSPDRYLTEFYLLGPDGLAEGYPAQAAIGRPLQVTLGVINRERTAQTYRIEAWIQDPQGPGGRRLVAALAPFSLDPVRLRQAPLTWRMPWPGQDQQVDFLLFLGASSTPYRRLRLILNVDPAP